MLIISSIQIEEAGSHQPARTWIEFQIETRTVRTVHTGATPQSPDPLLFRSRADLTDPGHATSQLCGVLLGNGDAFTVTRTVHYLAKPGNTAGGAADSRFWKKENVALLRILLLFRMLLRSINAKNKTWRRAAHKMQVYKDNNCNKTKMNQVIVFLSFSTKENYYEDCTCKFGLVLQ